MNCCVTKEGMEEMRKEERIQNIEVERRSFLYKEI